MDLKIKQNDIKYCWDTIITISKAAIQPLSFLQYYLLLQKDVFENIEGWENTLKCVQFTIIYVSYALI